MAFARSPRGLGLLPDEFWRLTPAEFFFMCEGLIEARREEKRNAAIRILAMSNAISGKNVRGRDIWEMVTGENPPWVDEPDPDVLEQIYQQSRVRK